MCLLARVSRRSETWAPLPVRRWRHRALFLLFLLNVLYFALLPIYRIWGWGLWPIFTAVVPLTPIVVVWLMEQRLAKRLRKDGGRFCWRCLYPIHVDGDKESVRCSECGDPITPEKDRWGRGYLAAPGRFWRHVVY